MTVLLKYEMRLGDIIRIFPIAKHYADQGHRVLIQCRPEYHGIFGAIAYAEPISEGLEAGLTFDLQIWPTRYNAFRASGLPWAEFVYTIYGAEHAGIDPTQIIFDKIDERITYQLPPKHSFICPFGYSQTVRHRFDLLWAKAIELFGDTGPIMVLCDPPHGHALLAQGFPRERIVVAHSLAHLPKLLRDAEHVLSINTASGIIAGAVRDSYYYAAEGNHQDDWITDASKIVTIGA